METFNGFAPLGWMINRSGVSAKETEQGRVHSGSASVNLENGAVLTQEIDISCGCYYVLSFFARGEGQQVGLTATLTFLDENTELGTGLTISVRSQDLPNANRAFAYYRGISTLAPSGADRVRVTFQVTATGGQSLDLDDVSLTIA